MNNCIHDFPSKEAALDKFKKNIDMFPKLRYKVKIIFGDYYYTEMSKEETIEKAFLSPKSQDHVITC